MANAPDDATYVLTLPDGDLAESSVIEGSDGLFAVDGGPTFGFTFTATGALGTMNDIGLNGIYFYDSVTESISTFQLVDSPTITVANNGQTPSSLTVSFVPGSSVQNISVTSGKTTEVGSILNIVGIDGIEVTYSDAGDGSGIYTLSANVLAGPFANGSFITLSDETADLTESISLGDLTTGILKVDVSSGIGTALQAIPNTDYAAGNATYVVNTTVNNTFPGNSQSLGERVYSIEVFP